MSKRYALVFFTVDQQTAVIPEPDITTEYSIGEGIAKCKWPGSKKLHSAKVLYVGTKELCKKKQEKVNQPGEMESTSLETSERSPSPVNEPSPSSSNVELTNELAKMTQLIKEMLYKQDYLTKKMATSMSEMRGQLDNLESNMNSLTCSLHRLEARLPAQSSQVKIDYNILSQYEVAKGPSLKKKARARAGPAHVQP